MDRTLAVASSSLPRSPRCLSCGSPLTTRRRRYCSTACKDELTKRLSLTVGLLEALNVRFATFSFSNDVLFLDLLQHRSRVVLSYTCTRSAHRRPAQDLWDMVEGLGRIWHAAKRRTGKRYLACQEVLIRARKNMVSPHVLVPREERRPAFAEKSLAYLKLTTADLLSPDATMRLKAAYRREAKLHHPDHGGSAARFRAIHSAHMALSAWIRHPTYTIHRGIPEKWSYDSQRRRKWLPPARSRTAGLR